ncbi:MULTISPECIES: hypothetical protein [unclassified Phyllobacterium]|uniref:hypothetical protein n=1 Tax=unclassified Phyllobacterium TaxID=2638441 RepID=UPI003012DEF4
MDDLLLTSAFRAHSAGKDTFTRRMAIAIADMVDASPKRVIVRLEQLELLKYGAWDWFQTNGGISKAQIEEVRADLRRALAAREAK